MLTVHAGWDWFHADNTPAERAAFAAKSLAAVMREDGDNNAAIVAAVKGVEAPAEFVELATMEPLIGDCFLAVAWDSQVVAVIMEDDDG